MINEIMRQSPKELSAEQKEPREALQEIVKKLTDRMHAIVDEHKVFAEPTNSAFAFNFSYFLFNYINEFDHQIHTSGPGIPEIDEKRAKELFAELLTFLEMNIRDATQTWSLQGKERTDILPQERYNRADALREALSNAAGDAARVFDQTVFKR